MVSGNYHFTVNDSNTEFINKPLNRSSADMTSMNDPCRMAEMVGILNDAYHESMIGHQQNFLWQPEITVSDIYIFGLITQIHMSES